ncbi:MAG: regulatory protein GemA [Oscillospiraceae bacterium]|nr:regulatory protein GemA [Oscillospiraceae bacterium]
MAAVQTGHRPASLRTLWAIAKSPELGMDEDDLHAVVYRETGKESMRQLTQGEINTIARVLQNMKDGVQRDTRSKRTDEGGSEATVKMRRKIYALCDALGWNNDHRRINGFVKRMCGVERIEWATPAQCFKIIEALKKMVERETAKGGQS